MSRYKRHERTFLGKAFWSVAFGLTCMLTIQIPLINTMSEFLPMFLAIFLAFLVSGIVDFHLNYFGTHGPSGWRILSLRSVDWHHFALSAVRQLAAGLFAGSINTCAQLLLRTFMPFVPQNLSVLMANAVSGVVGQSLKISIVYKRRHHHKALPVSRVPKYRQVVRAIRQYLVDVRTYLHYFMKKKHKTRSRGVKLPAGNAV